MKLNLGCGFLHLPGYINIDADPTCRPDVLHDLEVTPWPFEDNSFDELIATHVLEHLGATSKDWLAIWKEIWRVTQPDGTIDITVPHPRHDNFLIDPTHVRPIFPETIAMFDQMRNIRDYENGGHETKLGLMNSIDLEVMQAGFDLSEPWATGLNTGQVPKEKIQEDLQLLNNVCVQIRIKVRIVKPQRGTEWLAAFQKKS
jgi:predicted SAM-dependent methyltransferase